MNVPDMSLALCTVIAGLLMLPNRHQHSDVEKSGLGQLHFPISCSADVQQKFSTGVALLHSFWYDRANKIFVEIEQQDPQCAMAYWGEAMSLYAQLSGPPGERAMVKGRTALEKAVAAGAKTQRERDYIAALSLFYRDSGKPEDKTPIAPYTAAMEQLYKSYPDDHEAAAFYALALFVSSLENDERAVNRQKAAIILEKLFSVEPSHPGAAHYLIHIYDRPESAALGMHAATRYAQIAPASPHALHMPSHIFNRLGLWKESIESNLAAVAATRTMDAGIAHRMHPMDFLDYAYLQIGREDEAATLLEELKTLAAQQPAVTSYMMTLLPARHALELHDWKAAAALETRPGSNSWTREITYWAATIGGVRSGSVVAAREAFKELTRIPAVLRAKDPQYNEETDFYIQEAAAWMAHAEQDDAHAIALLRAAADRQDKFEAGQVVIPAREMLADLFLDIKQPAKALAEYELSLKVAPGRFNSLYGAARAAELAGNSDKATKYASELLKICDGGKYSSRPELTWARQKVMSASGS